MPSMTVQDITVARWLSEFHRRGAARFEQLGWPGRDQEYWRHTNFAPIINTRFTESQSAVVHSSALDAHRFSENEAAIELVFFNGFYQPHLSRLSPINGLTVQTLGAGGATSTGDDPADAALLERHLGQYASMESNPFAALNAGQFRDGAVIHVQRGVSIDKPIHVLFYASAAPDGSPMINHPRLLVVAGEDAQLSLVESYVGDAGGGVYFTNAVTEISAGAGSFIDHCRLQREDAGALHVAGFEVDLQERANFISHAATLGGKLTRNNLNVILNGERAEATLNGLVVISGSQHVDNHTLLHHEKAHCPSHELYKHVLADRATAVFKGQIFVQKDAQKTDSKQSSKSLLLSDEATMNSQPALEIYADDVKCTHGSTIGPVDEEAVFYLRSRGISLDAARHLLTYAFAADITRRIKVAPVRRRVEDFMANQHGLPQDLRITDLGQHDEKAR